jgi:hypothetical protein
LTFWTIGVAPVWLVVTVVTAVVEKGLAFG